MLAALSSSAVPATRLRCIGTNRPLLSADMSAADDRACPRTASDVPPGAVAMLAGRLERRRRRRRRAAVSSGRKTAPQTTTLSRMAEQTTSAPRHWYFVSRLSVSGANTNVPTPDPATATPAQRARQDAQLSPRDRATRRVSWNLTNCHATAQKLLVYTTRPVVAN